MKLAVVIDMQDGPSSVQFFIALGGIAMVDRGEFVNKGRDVGRDQPCAGKELMKAKDTALSSPFGILDHTVSKPRAVHTEGCRLLRVQVEAERGHRGWEGRRGHKL